MGERFFGIHPDEASLMDYPSCMQHHQYENQHHHHQTQQIIQNSAKLDHNMFNAGLAYFTNNNFSMAGSLESNNNNNLNPFGGWNPSLICFGGSNYNDLTSMMQYSNSFGEENFLKAARMPGNTGNYQLHDMIHQNGHSVPISCSYSHTNGGTSCLNRNRYMPYSHNRACAAAAAAANGLNCPISYMGYGGSTMNALQCQQQNGPFHQNYPMSFFGSAAPPSISSTAKGFSNDNSNEISFSNTGNIASDINLSSNPQRPITNSTANVTSAGSLNFVTPSLPVSSSSPSALSSKSSSTLSLNTSVASQNIVKTTSGSTNQSNLADSNQTVTLQVNNLDSSIDEANLRTYLLTQLKPITPVVSLVFEGSSYAKVTVPNMQYAKQVVAFLHRKKIGHKRVVVSYTRDASLTEFTTLRCQVAGLLKDVPHYTLPMYKFRELFQSRFKTSISVLDLYKMHDICSINSDENEEKSISLQQEVITSLENSPLMEGLQHSVPYCTTHFKREKDKGWAEQEMETLPNVFMKISEVKQFIYPLLKKHHGDIPIASLVHCIEGELNVEVVPNENGVNLEHLVCCVHGIQIQMNNFGIKILGWLEAENLTKDSIDNRNLYQKNSTSSDPLYQISREVIELIKMSPKSTMKFNRFIPAYHNHFGKQCRVADYGYTKLIELFEALSSVVQIMGDGENRQVTLTHRTQIRRFTSDLLRIIRANGNKCILLSQLSSIFSQTQNRNFDVTDYGVCDIGDILDGLVNSNIVVLSTVQNGKDILISVPKRKQTNSEIEKTSVFAGEAIELLANAPQYSIDFQKLVRSYHYHFAYQCRLSDYGFLKLVDLLEAVSGIIEMEYSNDEDKKVFLTPKVARRIFAEQLEELIRDSTGSANTCIKLDEALTLHKKKFGYQLQPQTLACSEILEAIQLLPFVEILKKEDCHWIICHKEDITFRNQCYRSCKLILHIMQQQKSQNNNKNNYLVPINDLIQLFKEKYNETLSEKTIDIMRHAIEMTVEEDIKYVYITKLMKFVMNVVRLLEQRNSSLMLSEIKSALNIRFEKCFQFGYPNVISILRAHHDVFVINSGAGQERSEISLVRNSELSLHNAPHEHFFGSIKQHPSRGKAPSRNATSRVPLGDVNNRFSLDRNSTAFQPKSQNNQLNIHNVQQLPTEKNLTANHALSFCSSAASSSLSSSSNNLNMSQNKENSFNTTGGNASFNSSGTSFSDPNTSFCCGNYINPPLGYPTKTWDNQLCCSNNNNIFSSNIGFEQVHDIYHPSKAPGSEILQNNNLFDYTNTVPILPGYDPPKPDTPPTDNMPFWIDPIWKNAANKASKRKHSLNIKLPELNMFNVLPMVMSPYTLSKTENLKRQMFDFENNDKKIA